MRTTIVVIPCYNEAARLDLESFDSLLHEPGLSLIFVDDGSSDHTLSLLRDFEKHSERISVLPLSPNRGKGEAVRLGMLEAALAAPQVVGFIDADLATPADEVARLAARAHSDDVDVIIGSRIAYLGAQIDRTTTRHLMGRVFATAASITLGTQIYDTQCGAKFFRTSELFLESISEPFRSRWAFDVELLGRMLAHNASIVEVPLQRWADVPGSKVGFTSMVKAGLDLLQIHSALARRRNK